MYGRQDRGGSREGKKSLRKNKVLIHVAKTKPELFQQGKSAEVSVTTEAPSIAADTTAADATLRMVDILCNLGSRKLADERDRVITRALREGVDAMVVFSPDADKQESLLEMAVPGQLYAVVGVHPDNTKKMTDTRALSLRVAALRPLALRAETVALFGGFDSTRDVASHFPQEKLLSMLLALGAEVHLPVILACTGDSSMVDRVVPAVSESGVGRIGLVHFGGTAADLTRFCSEIEQVAEDQSDEAPASTVYYVVTGTICDTSELGVEEAARIKAMSVDRLLLASDSPHFTPQNIPDPWIRERRNEPANLPFVLKQLATVLGQTESELASILYANTLRFFAIPPKGASQATESLASSADATQPSAQESTEPAPVAAEEPVPAAAPVAATPEPASSSSATVTRTAPLPALRRPVERPIPGAMRREAAAKAASAAVTEVQYACKRCRYTLFRAADVVPHHRLVGGAATSGADCQTIFANVNFAQSQFEGKPAEGDDAEDAGDDDAELAGTEDEGRLDCPKCQCRLGRCSRSAEVACSCGARKEAPAFAFARKKLDILMPIEDAQAAMAALQMDEERLRETPADDDSSSSDDERRKKNKKKVKKTNAGNFSSFRNKSYGVKAPKKGTQAQEQAE